MASPASSLDVIAARLREDEAFMRREGFHWDDYARLLAALPAAERAVIESISQRLFAQDMADIGRSGGAR